MEFQNSGHPSRLAHLAILLVFTLSLLPYSTAVFAAGVVGTGTPVSCTTAALNAAMSGGGAVSFNCGPSPLTIPTNTVFTVQNSRVASGYGGAIYNNSGYVSILNSRFIGNATGAAADAGGAITNSTGTMIVDGSLFQSNTSAYGGAISSVGSLTIRNSTFTDNRATIADGGALTVGGTIVITNTQITDNQAILGGSGINITSAGNLTLEDSLVVRNQATTTTEGSGRGGGILNQGTFTILRTTLEGNTAQYGGGLYDNSTNKTTTINDSLIKDNHSTFSGGGILKNNTTMLISITTFNGSIAAGVYPGGALHSQYGNLTLNYVTFAGNLAWDGGPIATTDTAWATILDGVIFASNPDANCDFHSTITWNGVNLSDDTSCFTATPTRLVAYPQLGPLQDNGGPTLTHLPDPGSPVIDAGGLICPATDQRGIPRPNDAGFDLGAVETAPAIPVCGGTFPAVADGWVDSASPDSNNGSGNELSVGLDPTSDRRTYLAFDLSALGAEPLYISQATLELPVAAVNSLSSEELLEVLSLDNLGIAQRLVLSPKTVRNLVSSIFHKLHVLSRSEAIALAREAGLGKEKRENANDVE